MEKKIILEVKNLKKYFKMGKKTFFQKEKVLKAVNDVSFTIKKGETFGLVGESGCGKTTVGRCITRLYELSGGEIIFEGKNIEKLDRKELMPYRQKMGMIFQDSYSSLDPRMTVGQIIAAPLKLHGVLSENKILDRVKELLRMVGLKGEHINRYPHEFSGGQRQRIGIARALALNPEFIVCDEPISALDVSIQAQVINILEELQEKLGLTYLFISHDLSMVRHISHRVGVMYLGDLVEVGDAEEIYRNMLHPYTQSLMSAVPIPDPIKSAGSKRIILQGDVPNPINPPSGCPFRTRCRYVMEICKEEKPKLLGNEKHMVACHKVKI
ncbi:MAG: ABC transporter ATP-binding protein [Fusobacteriaceae bacterium]